MNFGSLGIFITLAFLLPGVVISSAAVVLFPEVRAQASALSSLELLAVVAVVAFFHGHPVFALENYVLNPIWNVTHSRHRLSERQASLPDRARILMRAEAKGVNRNYYDQTFGEFVLFTNTSFWTLTLSVISWVHGKTLSSIDCGVFLMSFAALFYTAPFFKSGVLSALEALEEEVEWRIANPSSAIPAAAKEQATTGAVTEVKLDDMTAHASAEGKHGA